MKDKFWFAKSTLLHLRFPFSFFLMPVYMFALSTAETIHWPTAIAAFLIIHLLVFPSSNGYNSFQDKDDSSIGGIKNPPPVTASLYYVTLILDVVAIIMGLFISRWFAVFVLLFILVSRAYSYRGVRLKRYPVLSFLLVSSFQGGLVYLMSYMAVSNAPTLSFFSELTLICMAVSSLFIGSIYPLTQIYQHQSDKNDGVITISYRLGYRGTFVFSSILFLLATVLIYIYFDALNQLRFFLIFLVLMLPVMLWFLLWFIKVTKNTKQANYSNTMYMNMVTATCMNVFFLFILLNRYGSWY
jgi:1,4-dihydroxy-2-naphthoate octaprenyltransferase